MPASTRRSLSHRPKKYPDEIPAHQVIQKWFNDQPDNSLEAEFLLLCTRKPKDTESQFAWLINNGCACSIPQLKAWLKVRGIKEGSEAQALNQRIEHFAGLNAESALEAMSVRTVNILFTYAELINQKLESGELSQSSITAIIGQYPQLANQSRASIEALIRLKEKKGERELLLAGANRVKELVLTQMDKSVPFRDVLIQFFDAAIQRMIEETS